MTSMKTEIEVRVLAYCKAKATPNHVLRRVRHARERG